MPPEKITSTEEIYYAVIYDILLFTISGHSGRNAAALCCRI